MTNFSVTVIFIRYTCTCSLQYIEKHDARWISYYFAFMLSFATSQRPEKRSIRKERELEKFVAYTSTVLNRESISIVIDSYTHVNIHPKSKSKKS